MVTILHPNFWHREVVSGPRKNTMPVAREPTHAKVLIKQKIPLKCCKFFDSFYDMF